MKEKRGWKFNRTFPDQFDSITSAGVMVFLKLDQSGSTESYSTIPASLNPCRPNTNVIFERSKIERFAFNTKSLIALTVGYNQVL